MIHYCTYFDRNYLTRAMALHRSLVRHSPSFTLWALCLDDEAFEALEGLRLDGIRPIRLAELEAADPELLAVKGSRSRVEYYFTLSPCLPRYLLAEHPEIDLITYLDADLLFYSSPQPVFDELGTGSVLIVPHRFPDSLKHLEEYGVFNVGLLSFRSDAASGAVLDRWREQCLEWCYDRVEGDRFADQKYLDKWPGLPGVVVLRHPGADLAPWNVAGHRLDLAQDPPTVDGRPLVFYHFQGVKQVGPGLWDVALDRYGVRDHQLRDRLYRPYVRAVLKAGRSVRRWRWTRSPGGRSLRFPAVGWRVVYRRWRKGEVIVAVV